MRTTSRTGRAAVAVLATASLCFVLLALASSLGGENDQPGYVSLGGHRIDARIIGAVCLAVAAALAAAAIAAWRRATAGRARGS